MKYPDVRMSFAARNETSVLWTQRRAYRLITPLYGGGVEPESPDPISLVRVPSIRGQLRFWWRATCARRFHGQIDAMRRAEGEIWGSSSGGSGNQSAVQVELLSWREPTPRQALQAKNRKNEEINPGDPASEYSYVAFPLRGKLGRPIVGVEFELRISIYPSADSVVNRIRPDLEAALWAWENFGGVGARTRRGFGAIHLVSVDGVPVADVAEKELEQRLAEGFDRYMAKGEPPEGVPVLPEKVVPGSNFVLTGRRNTPLAAWKGAFDALSGFRQPRKFNPETKRPGRTSWPEADAIRRMARTHAPNHEPRSNSPDVFPRAGFGLPIIIQFKDGRRGRSTPGDPSQSTLRLHKHDRWASPLLIRPLACAGGNARAVAITLEGSSPLTCGADTAVLELEGNRDSTPVRHELTLLEAETILDANRNPLLGTEIDVVRAFLKYLDNLE